MNSPFNPIPTRTRILSAGTALLATAGLLWGVLALAGHYDDEYLQVARAQVATTTQHAQAPAAALRHGAVA